MSIQSIPMCPSTVFLNQESSLMDALKLMLENRINYVPMCNANGCFLGIISSRIIIRALVPHSAGVRGGLSNLKFMGDAERVMLDHLHKLENMKAIDHAQKEIVVLDPDCPITEAALRLTQGVSSLPVVGKDSKLRGMLSHRALLAYLMQRSGS